MRPSDAIGYYNVVEYPTRQRRARYLLDIGLYSVVYHHYWFTGKAATDHGIQAMLKDGELNTHFMLSWTNESWTARWDGQEWREIFIAQGYGKVADWRAHFDWLLPSFRHPQHGGNGPWKRDLVGRTLSKLCVSRMASTIRKMQSLNSHHIRMAATTT